MSRDIKFRGMTFDDEWIFGYYIQVESEGKSYGWIFKQGFQIAVKIETVGQCTGLKDKNGKECYKGDLSIINGNLCQVKFDVYFFSGWCFEIIGKPGSYTFNNTCKNYNDTGCQDFEVIGNIYQNPELLNPSPSN